MSVAHRVTPTLNPSPPARQPSQNVWTLSEMRNAATRAFGVIAREVCGLRAKPRMGGDIVRDSHAGSVHVAVGAGSIFIVPRGVWHRQTPRPVATVLAAIPTDHGPVSFADDPREG